MKKLKIRIFEDADIDKLNADLSDFLDAEEITESYLHKIETKPNHSSSYTYVVITISYWG